MTKRLRGLHENTREHRKARENMDRELAKVTDKAKDLSSRVKDIMDELSMLETVVEYQQDVQRGMKRNYAPSTNGKPKILETEYTATYVINDINRLYGVAERIHSAVGASVSASVFMLLKSNHFRSIPLSRFIKAKLQIYRQTSR